jgi:2-polyprenyl-3-methyl-5-hydroxy-6-metoxy-1,4-benzoquinol methylase
MPIQKLKQQPVLQNIAMGLAARWPHGYELAKRLLLLSLQAFYFVRTGRLLTKEEIAFPAHQLKLHVSGKEGLVCLTPDDPRAYAEPIETYSAVYEAAEDFAGCLSDVKAIAYHLPQFHTIPENNQWWGEGFTEWINTEKAVPLFPGHYQPRQPHKDIGYYDLAEIGTLRNQVKLAKRFGIHGFAFYHYWFHGNRLLGKPVDLLLNNPDINMPFCLCWANETWSKRWDGKDHEILIQQTFSEEDDIAFIKFLAPYFRDPRYLRVDGKPLLQVYRVNKLPSPKATAQRWRTWCRDHGIGELHLVAVAHSETIPSERNLRHIGFDAYAAFAPHRFPCAHISSDEDVFDSGYRFDYSTGVDNYCGSETLPGVYECCTLGWDNTARFGRKANIYLNFSLEKYYQWLVEAVERTKEKFRNSERLLFINAWNEWAEGAHLEPDKRYGYAYLNTTARALYGKALKSPDLGDMSVSASKYTKHYNWLRNAVINRAEYSLAKVNSLLTDGAEILEFGPAAGYFTRFLAEERKATVDIVEIDQASAEKAAKYARQCVVADLERDEWDHALSAKTYDFILFADVLEHLRNPLKVLKTAAGFLRQNGVIIISVPNVAHWQIVACLINNDFSYNDVGIMDKTHCHLFTEPTLRQMIKDAGLVAREVKEVQMPNLVVGCGTKWNQYRVPRSIKKFLKKRPFADAIQIVAACVKP